MEMSSLLIELRAEIQRNDFQRNDLLTDRLMKNIASMQSTVSILKTRITDLLGPLKLKHGLVRLGKVHTWEELAFLLPGSPEERINRWRREVSAGTRSPFPTGVSRKSVRGEWKRGSNVYHYGFLLKEEAKILYCLIVQNIVSATGLPDYLEYDFPTQEEVQQAFGSTELFPKDLDFMFVSHPQNSDGSWMIVDQAIKFMDKEDKIPTDMGWVAIKDLIKSPIPVHPDAKEALNSLIDMIKNSDPSSDPSADVNVVNASSFVSLDVLTGEEQSPRDLLEDTENEDCFGNLATFPTEVQELYKKQATLEALIAMQNKHIELLKG